MWQVQVGPAPIAIMTECNARSYHGRNRGDSATLSFGLCLRYQYRPRGKRVLSKNGNQKEIYSELLQTTVSPSQELRTPEFAGAVLGGLPQSLDGSPGYSQAFSTSNISISRDPIRTRYSLPPDLDEAPNSGNFAVAPDAPTASVPKENPTQIYISKHFSKIAKILR
jgi:hypothetical protein